jgi:hypothetical protein
MRVTFLRRPTRAVLVVGPHVVLQRRDVEAKDQFLALNRVVLAPPRRDVPLVTAVTAARLTGCRAHVRHGVIVFMTGAGCYDPGPSVSDLVVRLMLVCMHV